MQFFRQDDNFEMTLNTKDKNFEKHVENLGLCWEANAKDFDVCVLESRDNGNIKLGRHLNVDRTFVLKYRPTYKNLVQPFFSDYLENYVERQDHKYDDIIRLVRKLLKVNYENRTSLKDLTLCEDGMFRLNSVEITRQKKKWSYSKYIYTMNLRYYEFYLLSNCGCKNSRCCEGDCKDCKCGESKRGTIVVKWCEKCNSPECDCKNCQCVNGECLADNDTSSSSYEIKKEQKGKEEDEEPVIMIEDDEDEEDDEN